MIVGYPLVYTRGIFGRVDSMHLISKIYANMKREFSNPDNIWVYHLVLLWKSSAIKSNE